VLLVNAMHSPKANACQFVSIEALRPACAMQYGFMNLRMHVQTGAQPVRLWLLAAADAPRLCQNPSKTPVKLFLWLAQIGRTPEHNQFVCGFGPLLTHPGCAVVLLADLGHAPLADRLRNETECSLDSRALDTWQVRRHATEAQHGRNVPWKKLALETR